MTEEIKPCPFCGGEDIYCNDEYHYSFVCQDCFSSSGKRTTYPDAIKAWNQRPYDYDMPAIVKKVQQIEKENKQLHDLLIRADINLQQWIMSFPRAVDKEDKTLIELFKEANQSCKQPE